MRVTILPEVLEYLENLSEILYEKHYLSFKETATKYVLELYDDITATLPTRACKPAPPCFDKFGKDMYYATFRRNRQTVWYVFFTKYDAEGEIVCLVRYIANNHVVAQWL
jgi:hypothetical protein